MALAEQTPQSHAPAEAGAAGGVHPTVILLALAGVVAAGGLFRVVKSQEEERATVEFNRRVDAQHLSVRQTLHGYSRLLVSVQKLFDPTPDSLTNHMTAAHDLLKSQGLPLFALQWMPRVRHAERAAFEAELRRAGAPSPVIRTFTADREWVRAPDQEEYFPRRFSVPMTNFTSLGADFASPGIYGEAMLAAVVSGQPGLDTRRGTNALPTFVFVLPTYVPMAALDTVAARRASLTGFLLAYVRSADLALELSQGQREAGVDVLFSAPLEAGDSAAAHFLPNAERVETATPALAAAMRAGPHRELVVKLQSLPVTFLYRPAPEWLAAQSTLNPHGALASTLLLTAVAAGFLHSLHRRRQLVEAEVHARTAELKASHTEVRLAGSRLRESEQLYQSLVSHLPQFVFRKDVDGRFTFVNERFAAALNRPVADIVGRTDAEFFPPELAAKFAADDARVLATGKELEMEERTELGAGVGYVRVSKTALRDEAGHVTGLQGIAWDITEQHRMEAALRASEARFRSFMDHAPAPAWLKDTEHRLRFLNAAFEKLFQKPAGDLLGLSDHELLPAAVADAVQANDRAVRAANRAQELLEHVPGADGRMRHWLVVKFPFDGPAGESWVGGIAFDATERVQAQAALQQREAQMRLFVEHTPAAVAMFDREMRYVVASRRWQTDYQIEGREILGRSHYEVFPEIPERWREIHRRCLAGAVERCEEDEFPRADGQTDWVRWEIHPWHDGQGAIGGIIMFTEVITERRRAEQARLGIERKMVETQKLESLGVLAGGIAHDFNNLLTSILGNASLLRLDLPADSPLDDPLDQIEQTSLRAAELCKQMLAYSGRGKFQLLHVDIGRLVEDTTHLLKISISKKAVLKFSLAPGLPPVAGDPTQLRQIVMNLIINASEAIGGRSGLIVLTTGLVRADRDYLATTYLAPELREGDYVFLEISDNGGGMTPEVQARIFDPFFTTKFTGRGLGLAAVLGIVRGHHGALKVYSEAGKGSSFKLLLPVATGPARDEGSAPAGPAPWRGTGRVLVVDDEETVRTIAARLMESLGFQVTVAEDGRAGVAAFQRQPDAFKLVLMDLTMPHCDGVEAFGLLRRIRPEVPVILMSGFNEQDAIASFTGKGLAGFLQKPFDVSSLRETVRAALQADA